MKPTIGRIVIYRTDRRNGLTYDLPAIITCTFDSHPGDYPDGHSNPLPKPKDENHVHLTVFSPGGFGTTIDNSDQPPVNDEEFKTAAVMTPGSGTYVEHNVPMAPLDTDDPEKMKRTWRWPTIEK